jgi:hypothetical protein
MKSSSIRRNTTFGTVVVIAVLTALSSLTGTGPLLLGGGQAEAVIGRPATPMSYAGVARRTTRRAAYAGAAYHAPPAYVAPAVVAPTTVVTTLPAGCAQATANGTVYYQCEGARYAPSYNGTTLVYQPM